MWRHCRILESRVTWLSLLYKFGGHQCKRKKADKELWRKLRWELVKTWSLENTGSCVGCLELESWLYHVANEWHSTGWKIFWNLFYKICMWIKGDNLCKVITHNTRQIVINATATGMILLLFLRQQRWKAILKKDFPGSSHRVLETIGFVEWERRNQQVFREL